MMAGPLGYPDYQRLSNIDSPTLVSEPQVARVAIQTGGDLDVSRYSHLRFRIIPDQKGSYLFIKLLWKRTRNGGEIEGERTIVVSPLNTGPEGELVFSVPNRGPFVTWEVGEQTRGLKEWLSEWRIGADNRNIGGSTPPVEPILIPRTTFTLGVNATKLLFPKYYYEGLVMVSFSTGGNGNWSAFIETYNLATTAWMDTTFTLLPAAPNILNFVLPVPLGAWRFSVANTTGVEHTAEAVVVPYAQALV